MTPAGVWFVDSVAPFDPSTITGLQGWWKADALSLADNDPVASWTDSAGLLHHLLEATTQPLYKTGILNSLPVVRFDGVDDRLRAGFTLTQPATWFVVAKWRSAFAASECLIDAAGTSFNQYVFRTSSTQLSLYAGSATACSVTTTPEAFHYYTAIFNGASSSLQADGGAPVTGNPGAGSADGAKIGRSGADTEAADVDVAEILVYNSSLSGTDQGNVRTYLAGKYAL